MIFNVLILFGNNKHFYGFVIDSIVSDFEWKRKEGFDGGCMPLLLCDNLYIKLVRVILFLSGKVQAFGISWITLLHRSVFFVGWGGLTERLCIPAPKRLRVSKGRTSILHLWKAFRRLVPHTTELMPVSVTWRRLEVLATIKTRV